LSDSIDCILRIYSVR